MSWSYDPDLLATNTTMQVRLLLGDTDATQPLLQDEEIDYQVSVSAGIYYAAAKCCERIAASVGKNASKTVGPLSVTPGEVVANFKGLAKTLRMEAMREGGASVNFGGNSIADRETAEQNDDAIGTAARTDGMRNPSAITDPWWRRTY